MLIALLLLAGSLTACSGDEEKSPAANWVVGDDGLAISVENVSIAIPAGVLETGVEVDVERAVAEPEPIEEIFGFSTWSNGIDVEIADDAQLDGTAKVEFRGEITDSDATDFGWAILQVSDDGAINLVPATADASSGTVTGEVEHFSEVWPIRFNFNEMSTAMMQGLGLEYPQPDCVGNPAEFDAVTYSAISPATAWVCTSNEADSLSVLVSANSAIPFLVESPEEASVGIKPNGFSLEAAVEIALLNQMDLAASNQSMVFPGGDPTFTYSAPPRPFDLSFDQRPDFLMVMLLTRLLDVAAGGTGVKLLEGIDGLECLADVIPAGLEFSGGLDAEAAAGIYRSFFSCIEPALGALPGPQRVALALVSGAPQFFTANILGAINEIAGVDNFSVAIDTVYGDGAIPPETAETFLGEWIGQIDQSESSSYSVRMSIRQGNGTLIGRVRYPELDNCGGYLDSAEMRGESLAITEHITTGSRCLTDVDLVLTPTSGGLDYSAEDGLATGFLTRVEPLEADVVAPYLGSWVGAVDQPGSRPYSVRLELAWSGGAVTGSTVYPELGNCTGVLESFALEGDELRADERITFVGETCIDTTLFLKRSGSQLEYRFDGSGITGTGTLSPE